MKRRVYRAGAMLALMAATAAITVVLTDNILPSVIAQQADRWSDTLRLAASGVGGYLFGSIPFGFIIIGVLRERDITEEGSGRTGGTNALRAGGFGAATLTVIGDLLKGLAGVTLARIVFVGNLWAEVFAGWGVILGHNASIYLAFRGGAGTAPNMGVAAGLWFPSLIFTLPFFPIGMFVIRIASLTSLAAGLAIVVIFAVRALLGQGPWEYVAYGLGALFLVAYALRPNIQRLLNGTESWVDLRAQEKEKRREGIR
jgi:acyl phosphate:glycerol-3-phosphate acyltransferase